VVHQAIAQANIDKKDLSAIAFTRGPGLLGSLLVGTSFAKSLALGWNIPLIEVNHLQGHVLAHFIEDQTPREIPEFPFLAVTISGGHTQIIEVNSPFNFKVIGQTLDDAIGEAFDKSAKILGFDYPGGPLIDHWAQSGNPHAFNFPIPKVGGLDFSFSGLKTSILYFIQEQSAKNQHFIDQHRADLCASIQHTIVSILMKKIHAAVAQTGITQVAIGGGVSANSGVRNALKNEGSAAGWTTFIPPFEYCTDNAAMIGIVGYFKYLEGQFSAQNISAQARYPI
jgi:N6-L-threonylcarbamoyladenine synthase